MIGFGGYGVERVISGHVYISAVCVIVALSVLRAWIASMSISPICAHLFLQGKNVNELCKSVVM